MCTIHKGISSILIFNSNLNLFHLSISYHLTEKYLFISQRNWQGQKTFCNNSAMALLSIESFAEEKAVGIAWITGKMLLTRTDRRMNNYF